MADPTDIREPLSLEALAGVSCLAQGVLLRLYVLADGAAQVDRHLSRLASYPVCREDVERALDELAAAGLVDLDRDRRRTRDVTLFYRLET